MAVERGVEPRRDRRPRRRAVRRATSRAAPRPRASSSRCRSRSPARTSSTSSTATTSASTSSSSTPTSRKVLVRYNPDGDAETNKRQLERSSALADWLHENDRKFLFELLVPAEDAPARAGRRRHRPLRRRAAPGADAPRDRGHPGLRHRGRHLEDRGRRRARGRRDARRADALAATAARTSSACCSAAARQRREGRPLAARRPRPSTGFVGFAIGRSIWWDALKGFLDGSLEREDAAEQIADNYLRFIKVYEEAEQGAAASSHVAGSAAARAPPSPWAAATRSPSRRGRGAPGVRRPAAPDEVVRRVVDGDTLVLSRVASRASSGWTPRRSTAGWVFLRPPPRRRSRSARCARGCACRYERGVEERDRYGRALRYVLRSHGGRFVQRAARAARATPCR